MNPFKKSGNEKTKKLSLDEFKAKAGDSALQESLEKITGGILGCDRRTIKVPAQG